VLLELRGVLVEDLRIVVVDELRPIIDVCVKAFVVEVIELAEVAVELCLFVDICELW